MVMAANTAMWNSTVVSGCQMTTNSCFQIIMAEHWMRLFLEDGNAWKNRQLWTVAGVQTAMSFFM